MHCARNSFAVLTWVSRIDVRLSQTLHGVLFLPPSPRICHVEGFTLDAYGPHELSQRDSLHRRCAVDRHRRPVPAPLTHLTCVGDSFLDGCGELTTLDLAPLTDVTSVGKNFLRCCAGLTCLDLSPFVHGCGGLTTLDLAPFAHLTSVGYSFLDGCGGLTTLDLTPLASLTSIGNFFLKP